ncbi:hypothetical protein ABTZ03_33735 [Kitasatospora sp. NPDC096077]|uniref:tetratricopeptide repeat protein n=1 Tax=Kitasatospora sp. NPDC096077 TaxID=3155544 RepID=UPI003317239B
MISVTSARTQVAAQSRLGRLAAQPAEAVAQAGDSPGWQALGAALGNWQELDVPTRTTVVALLAQLGFHRYVVQLVPRPSAADSESEQLSYEVARAAHQYNRMSSAPMQIFSWLAEQAGSPVLRLLSALQFVSNQVREHRNTEEAAKWLAVSAELVERLKGPDWLVHLGRSRFHRAAGLFHTLTRDSAQAAAVMTAGLLADDELALALPRTDTATGVDAFEAGLVVHYHRENRRLVLEALLKLDTLAGTSHAPKDAVGQLLALDPYDPDPNFTIGSYLERQGRVEEAAERYLDSAASGTVRGAHAACMAADCYEKLGNTDGATRARQLWRDLDPAAAVPPSVPLGS